MSPSADRLRDPGEISLAVLHLPWLSLLALALTTHAQFIELDDILRPDLMPSRLMMMTIEGPKTGAEFLHNQTDKAMDLGSTVTNGSWGAAFDTMTFHRKMFNEYLCRSFVAGKILNRLRGPTISNRIGQSADANSIEKNNNRKSRADSVDIKENLLFDPGSSNYKNWLSKTTTLDDIRRHYDKDSQISRAGDDAGSDDYEGGEITGYAVPGPIGLETKDYAQTYPGGFVPSMGIGPIPQDAEKHGGDFDYTPHHIHFHGNEHKETHEVLLPDIFEVALTALAFLSFGLFLLQVIMCITSAKTTTTMMPVMDQSGSMDPEAFNAVRFKRELPDYSATDKLAKRALRSIEIATTLEGDNGVCLRRVLCEDNRRSRTMRMKEKLLVPIWSLGMSWLSGRIVQKMAPAATILESLKACALGLANANCKMLYSKCDVKI